MGVSKMKVHIPEENESKIIKMIDEDIGEEITEEKYREMLLSQAYMIKMMYDSYIEVGFNEKMAFLLTRDKQKFMHEEAMETYYDEPDDDYED